ncbi:MULTISPECIES: N-acetyltransferase [unclassified Janthinobacterium]|uniref:GNAT family N-acetyltransferase n=1 Tax=unclassified Janthinobacterium TaxID=2610881 RepID=UPI0016070F07|nr:MULTISPECIES: GNAT family N-acetyltransferase [unclassified Janthinobacterium]MBB5371174.1 GNAT superfamily N-acetyltransferase [Janthinobacterium sp. K2C7]MBB5383980.1 GNAT superfamily N-acetyltransferase [Janthinobacterium sp. K2Li3]MBB5389198.1 GNAT superfamily N-acetyltransferase [Janthinobacterium sp. K2E3]
MTTTTHFIAGGATSAAQRARMASLLFATSYLEYCSYANKLGLPLVALQQRQNIDPYLAHIEAMLDGEERFAGFYNAATIADYAALPAISYYRDEMRSMDAQYEAFIDAHARPDDLFVASLAIEEGFRGQGLFHVLFARLRALAQEKNSPRIVLAVWEQGDALAVYLKQGFVSLGRYDGAYPIFFDRLHFLAYDLTARRNVT